VRVDLGARTVLIMPRFPDESRSITDDIGRLMRAFPQILKLPNDDPMVEAWMSWKRALLAEIRVLEVRERHLAGSEDLWIELTRDQSDAAGFGIDDLRDTRSDVQ
jgi:hypothetical protein